MNEHINDGAMYLVSHALMRDCDYCPYCGTGLSSNSMCATHGRITESDPVLSVADRRSGNFATEQQ